MIAWIGRCLIIGILGLACGGQARVEVLGVFGESRKAQVLGQDGVTPIPLSNTLTMWTFGDTILGSWKQAVSVNSTFSDRAVPSGMISNSLAFTARPNAENVRTLRFVYHQHRGKISPFLTLGPGENELRDRLWPMGGIRLGDRVYVYYMRIHIIDPDKPFSFALKGIGLARWDMPAQWKPGDPVRFTRLPDLFIGNVPAFGDSVVRRGDYLYTIGHYADGKGGSPVKIARVRVTAIENPAAYEFLGRGGRWVRDMARAHPLLGDVMGECSLTYNDYLRKWVIIYCQLYTNRLAMIRFADFAGAETPAKEILLHMPALKGPSSAGLFYYSGKEIFAEGRDIYAICINPEEYQPYLIRIRLGFW